MLLGIMWGVSVVRLTVQHGILESQNQLPDVGKRHSGFPVGPMFCMQDQDLVGTLHLIAQLGSDHASAAPDWASIINARQTVYLQNAARNR